MLYLTKVLKKSFPQNWKVIMVKKRDGMSEEPLILSPEGKKFHKLHKAFMEMDKQKKSSKTEESTRMTNVTLQPVLSGRRKEDPLRKQLFENNLLKASVYLSPEENVEFRNIINGKYLRLRGVSEREHGPKKSNGL